MRGARNRPGYLACQRRLANLPSAWTTTRRCRLCLRCILRSAAVGIYPRDIAESKSQVNEYAQQNKYPLMSTIEMTD